MQIYRLLFFVFICFVSTSGLGQTNQTKLEAVGRNARTNNILTSFQWHPSPHLNQGKPEAMGNSTAEAGDLSDVPLPDSDPDSVGPDYKKIEFNSQLEWYKAQTDYYIYSYKYYRRLFEWQLGSSKVIFGMVIFIVLTGIVFSGVQFYMALFRSGHAHRRKTGSRRARIHEDVAANENQKDAERRPQQEEEESEAQFQSSFKASPQGIEISSPIVGIIILAMSIVFFYLYLKFVYPITFLSDGSEQHPPPAAAIVHTGSE